MGVARRTSGACAERGVCGAGRVRSGAERGGAKGSEHKGDKMEKRLKVDAVASVGMLGLSCQRGVGGIEWD